MKKSIFLVVVFIVFLVAMGIGVSADPVSLLGTSAIVKDNSIYMETSDIGGKHNIVTPKNPFVPKDRKVTINGVSFLGANGRIITFSYIKYENVKKDLVTMVATPEDTCRVMYHICNGKTDLGWIKEGDVSPTDEPKVTIINEKTPQQFAKAIEQKKGTTVILIDQSGSMEEFVAQATSAFNEIDFKDKVIMVFAETTKTVSSDGISEFHNGIGETTNIYGALNESAIYNPENIIIISDLCDNHNEELKAIPGLKTIDILCPDPNYPPRELEKIKSVFKYTQIRLDMIS